VRKNSFYCLCFLLLLVSCRKEIKNEFDNLPRLPVVNSILVAGESVKVHLSLSTNIHSIDFSFVENAEILLYINDVFTEKLSYQSDGIYESASIVESQKKYSCKIIIPHYDTVFCENSIPAENRILDIKYISVGGLDEEGFTHPAVELLFENDPTQSLYYEVIVRYPSIEGAYELDSLGNDVWTTYDIMEEAYLMDNNDHLIMREGVTIGVFNNEGLKESSCKLTLNFKTYSSLPNGTEKIIVELRSISYSYYQYVKTRYLNEQGRYSSSLENYPVTSLYSNIKNGYGIFAGYSSVVSDTIFTK